MSLWLTIALQAAQPIPEVSTFDLAASAKPVETIINRQCSDEASADEIVVCGHLHNQYRLPLPIERSPTDRVRGDVQGGMAALTPSGSCGIFVGERRCGKREAAEYGYGNGRDPITVLSRLVKKVVDPDAD